MMIEVSSAVDLERMIADLSAEAPSVQFSVPRLNDLFEAGPLLRRLQQICGSRERDWVVDEDSLAALLKATKYYKKLDLLELRLGVLRLEVLDIEDGIAVRKLRREIVAEEQPISITSQLLDTITVEAQEIERIANVLGFTGSLAVYESAAIEDNIFTKGVSTGHDGVHGGDEKEDAGLEGLLVTDCLADHGEDSKEEAFCVGNLKTVLDPEIKTMMKVVIVWKIEHLCQVLRKTKRGQFCLDAMN